jgi:hypothetical protein
MSEPLACEEGQVGGWANYWRQGWHLGVGCGFWFELRLR